MCIRDSPTVPGPSVGSMSAYMISLAQEAPGYNSTDNPWPPHSAIGSATHPAVDDMVIVLEEEGVFTVQETPVSMDVQKIIN